MIISIIYIEKNQAILSGYFKSFSSSKLRRESCQKLTLTPRNDKVEVGAIKLDQEHNRRIPFIVGCSLVFRL